MKRPSCRTQKGAPYGVGVHVDETGIVEEDAIGKRDCEKRCGHSLRTGREQNAEGLRRQCKQSSRGSCR